MRSPAALSIACSATCENSIVSASMNESCTCSCSPSISMFHGVSTPSRRRRNPTTSNTERPWSASTSRRSVTTVSAVVVRPKRSEPVIRALRTRRLGSTLPIVLSAIWSSRFEL